MLSVYLGAANLLCPLTVLPTFLKEYTGKMEPSGDSDGDGRDDFVQAHSSSVDPGPAAG